MNRFFLILPLIFIFTSCGSGGETFSRAENAIAVIILNSKSFNPNIEHARILKYRVSVEGNEIIEPIEAEFPGDAVEGVIENVPAGTGRVVSVTAINANEQTIRAGETCCVEVTDGVTDVAVELESVPIFANIRDDAFVDNTRLAFQIFSDAGESVVVENASGENNAAVADASTGLSEVVFDTSTGLGRVAPVVMPAGEYKFRVRNLKNGRASEVGVHLLDGERKRPAPFFASGFSSSAAVVRAGAM